MRGPAFPWAGLLVLASVIVLAVTTEILPTGLLPQMSTGLGVSQSAIGLLVSFYALTVAGTSVPLSILTRRWRRHRLLAASAAVMGSSALLTAFAPGYDTAMAFRLIGALAHSMFWATVGAYPGHVVAREHVGRAVGIVLGGSTVGFVVGVPLATSLGQSLGWRAAFAIVGGLLLASAGAALAFLPRVARIPSVAVRSGPSTPRGRDRTVLPVLAVCFLALIAMTGHYAFYRFIALYGADVLGLPGGLISVLFLLIGVGGGIGLIIAATVLSRRTARGILISLGFAMLSVVAFALTGERLAASVPAVFAWSIALGMLPVLMQTRLLQVTSASFRDLGNAIYTATFNAGIGGGALLGALLLNGFGLGALPWFYVGALAISGALAVVMLGMDARSAPRRDAQPSLQASRARPTRP